MHNPESVLENEMHKLFCDFEIQMDHLILARQPNLVMINKKKRTLLFLLDYGVKLKECKKKDKYLVLTRELKNLWNMKVMMIPIVIGALGTVTKGLVQGLEDLEMRMSRDHQNYIIIEIGQNTEKSPGNLRRLAVTQTPVRNHWLMLV